MSKILGSDITVGTTLLWLEKVGAYYPATVERRLTVSAILPSTNPNYIGMMTFHNQYPQHTWFIEADKEYALADEYQGLSWDEGNPNTPR